MARCPRPNLRSRLRQCLRNPLTGWSGGADTQEQVILAFPTLEAAKAYCAREGIDFHIVPSTQPKLKLQSYADNFR